MDRAKYRDIKSRLDFDRNYAVTLSVVLADGVLLWTALTLINSESVGLFLLSQCLLAVLFFHGFCLLHEAGHGNCSSSRALNTLTGLCASVLCFTPYFPWKHIHQKHHVWTGNPAGDPTGHNLQRWREAGKVPLIIRLAWRSWVPLGALAQHFVYWRYPFVLMREDRSRLATSACSVLLLPLTYALLHLQWPALFNVGNFALAFVIYLMAEELVNLPHHSDLFHVDSRLALPEQWRATRSAYYPPLVAELLVLNFNFHIEHHLYPALPWHRLRRARSLIKPALGDRYRESRGIGWNLEMRGTDIQTMLLEPDVAEPGV